MLGFVSAILPGRDLDGVFGVASRPDCDCAELMGRPLGEGETRRYAGVTRLNADGLHRSAAADLARPAAGHGGRVKDVRVDHAALREHAPPADPELYHTPTLPGPGDVNFGRFAGLLYEGGHRGPVRVEVEDRALEGRPADVGAVLKISRDVLRPYFPAP